MIINVFLLFIGMVLHSAAAIILTVPIFMPRVTQLGIDPIHFGILLTLSIAIGQQNPPVASVLVTVLLMVTYVPAVPLFLVDVLYGK